jgi:Domain of unknown function (DUF4252)
MNHRTAAVLLGAALAAAPALAQNAPSPLLLPPAVEKELSAKASDVTEVTLGKNMLGFAAKFMDKDGDDAATRQLIQNLDGIYVREYEFDKEGQYSMDQIDQLRKTFATPEWSPIVHVRERKSEETTDVYMKMVNGESHGIFVLATEPKELTIVLILGPIRMEDLGRLQGLNGLGALGSVERPDGMKVKESGKAKDKVKKDGDDQ